MTKKKRHPTVLVTPSDPKHPGTLIKDSRRKGPKWPAGTAAGDLIKNVTRTIYYIDRQTGLALATPVVHSVQYRRVAVVDLTNGKLVGYQAFGKRVNLKHGNEAWQAQGSTSLPAVVSADLTRLGYTAPSKKIVDELIIPADYTGRRTLKVKVYYHHAIRIANAVQPGIPGEPINIGDPHGPKWPLLTSATELSQTVTRTIIYLNQVTGEPVAKPVIQLVTHRRTALVDAVNGDFVGYDTNDDGQVDTTDGLNAWIALDTDRFSAVVSPQLNGFSEPSLPVIGEKIIHGFYHGELNGRIVVYYQPIR